MAQRLQLPLLQAVLRHWCMHFFVCGCVSHQMCLTKVDMCIPVEQLLDVQRRNGKDPQNGCRAGCAYWGILLLGASRRSAQCARQRLVLRLCSTFCKGSSVVHGAVSLKVMPHVEMLWVRLLCRSTQELVQLLELAAVV